MNNAKLCVKVSVREELYISVKQRTLEVNDTFSFFNCGKDESNVHKINVYEAKM